MSRAIEDRNRRMLRARDTIGRFYGTDCALRDPFGNPIRITQPPEGPITAPSAEELRAQA